MSVSRAYCESDGRRVPIREKQQPRRLLLRFLVPPRSHLAPENRCHYLNLEPFAHFWCQLAMTRDIA